MTKQSVASTFLTISVLCVICTFLLGGYVLFAPEPRYPASIICASVLLPGGLLSFAVADSVIDGTLFRSLPNEIPAR